MRKRKLFLRAMISLVVLLMIPLSGAVYQFAESKADMARTQLGGN